MNWKRKIVFVAAAWAAMSILCAGAVLAAGKDIVRLTWTPMADAVMYEVEITDVPVQSMFSPAEAGKVVRYKDVFTHGVELDTSWMGGEVSRFWWRVRALNLDGTAISPFTEPKPVAGGEWNPQAPLPTVYPEGERPVLLYPAYSWIPVRGAAAYEVEVASVLPEEPESGMPSPYRVRSYVVEGELTHDCYDWHPYIEEGSWWWRVRALDGAGKTMGRWSEAHSFTVKKGFRVAVFGDSVTHGGGAVSNAPDNPAYDWTAHIGFPVKNLGRSGDTTATMLERFRQDVLPFAPKILVIMGGINDLRGGTSGETVIQHLEVMGEACRQEGIIPVYVSLPPVRPERIQRVFGEKTAEDWQDGWDEVNNWIVRQPHYVDVAKWFMDGAGVLGEKYAADGLHLDTEAKAKIGQAVGDYLRKTWPE